MEVKFPLKEIKCKKCGGNISPSEFETRNFVCLVLSCNECNTIVDKVWQKKKSEIE